MYKKRTSEDYLKCIWELYRKNGIVRSVDIANALRVTKPSVCNAVKKLSREGMIFFDEKRSILFTEAGWQLAEKMGSRQSLIKKTLTNIGVSEKTAATDARRIGNAISDETYECLSEYMKKENK